jgi:ADP-ribosylglycohydrolase
MNIGQDLLLGIAVGDALGVPVEFKSRDFLRAHLVKDMLAYGTHNQPLGTWSDDSSLSFCLAESLAVNAYDLKDIAKGIVNWFQDGRWTPHGVVFDIGGQTRNAIDELVAIFKRNNFAELYQRHNDNEFSNGNGALMRILPLSFETFDLPILKKWQVVKEVGSLTHAHIRSNMACMMAILFTEELLDGMEKNKAYLTAKKQCLSFFESNDFPSTEVEKFTRILAFNIQNFEEEEIKSDGYVLHTLEAALWCVIKGESYEETVLLAVNLGEDTDTTAAIAGGMAGLIYGASSISRKWLDALVKVDEIKRLGKRLFDQYYE